MSERTTRADYAERLDRAIVWLADHLDEALDLRRLADVACMSPYHFHRIYHGMQGETVADTVRRFRLHRAAVDLIAGTLPVDRIARRAGYASQEAFTRAFKAAYAAPPARYRSAFAQHADMPAKEGPMETQTGYAVTIRETPPIKVAALAHAGDYQEIGATFERLMVIAAAQGLAGPDARSFGMYYDDPETTPTRELRSDACLTVPADWKPAGGLQACEIRGGRYAVALHVGPYAELTRAYMWLLGSWLPQSGEEAADAPCVEQYLNDPRTLPPTEWRTEVWLPCPSGNISRLTTDSAAAILGRRLHNQRLAGSTLRDPAAVVAWLGAVQAQDYPGAKWALAQRANGIVDADVERTYDEGAILRTHVMRPTWHFVAPADIRWLLALTAPRVMALMATYDRKLELDAAVYSRSHKALMRALRGGRHLTRTELAEALARAGIAAHGQRLGHLMMRAELDAVVCSGPMRGKQFTYALLEERVPPAPRVPGDEALAELATRYFVSHGPAIPQDFAWWSGLTVRDAKTGIEMAGAALARESIGGVLHWRGAGAHAAQDGAVNGIVYLLPNYDEYGIAYKNRDALLARVRALFDPYPKGVADFPHMLIVDGQWSGSWKRIVAAKGAEVVVRPARPLKRAHARALAAAAERYAAFLGIPVTLSIV